MKGARFHPTTRNLILYNAIVRMFLRQCFNRYWWARILNVGEREEAKRESVERGIR